MHCVLFSSQVTTVEAVSVSVEQVNGTPLRLQLLQLIFVYLLQVRPEADTTSVRATITIKVEKRDMVAAVLIKRVLKNERRL
jgi:hypothetical protein